MARSEPSIFDETDDAADERAMREGEADGDAGRTMPHAAVSKWLATWGTPEEQPPPREWFE
ncbi:MAG TPA: antitoxin [Caulobacteraceae bacterium]|nr:antitoxin [Caulobacteraceae bacterium]